MQQDLARPEVLERFLDDKEQVELIRACFAGTAAASCRAMLTCCHAQQQQRQFWRMLTFEGLNVVLSIALTC